MTKNLDFCPSFLATFDSERACRRFLFKQKWPSGFTCPFCGYAYAQERQGGRRWVCGRRGCTYKESATQRTLAESLKKPLRTWFWGLWIYAQAPAGMTARKLQAELGLGSYQTAWTWCRQFREALLRMPEIVRMTRKDLAGRSQLVDLPAAGLHGWHDGGEGPVSVVTCLTRGARGLQCFLSWLNALNQGRVSKKHGQAYLAEYLFWEEHACPKERWARLSRHLCGGPAPYWGLVGRVNREMPLISNCKKATGVQTAIRKVLRSELETS